MLNNISPRHHDTGIEQIFQPSGARSIISANLGQDHWLRGQIGHPEYHFDQNAFLESWAYIERNRTIVRSALEAGDNILALQALGRLAHAAQDFYAHSNYVALWLGRFPPGHCRLPMKLTRLTRLFSRVRICDPGRFTGRSNHSHGFRGWVGLLSRSCRAIRMPG